MQRAKCFSSNQYSFFRNFPSSLLSQKTVCSIEDPTPLLAALGDNDEGEEMRRKQRDAGAEDAKSQSRAETTRERTKQDKTQSNKSFKRKNKKDQHSQQSTYLRIGLLQLFSQCDEFGVLLGESARNEIIVIKQTRTRTASKNQKE